MWHTVLACATLLNLSTTTKVEMQGLLPKAAEYCLEHPTGKLSVTYGAFESGRTHNKSQIMQQGSDFYETNAN